MNELAQWVNFYTITSQAAAVLIGLLFVCISFAADRSLKDTATIRIYLTPTIIYFVSVFFLAAVLLFPYHTKITVTIYLCLSGVVGLIYAGAFLIHRNTKKDYKERHDRIPYAGLPFIAYGLIELGGIMFAYYPKFGLLSVAASMLSLLAIAIRNSWAIAIYLISTPKNKY